MYSTMKEKSSQHLVSTQFDFILTFVLIVVSFAHVRNLEAEWKWLTSWAAITGNGPEIFKKVTKTNTIFHVYMHSKQKHSHPENQYEAQRLFTNLKFYYSNFYFQALQPNAYSLTAICISTAENEKLGLRCPSWITPSSEKLHALCVCVWNFSTKTFAINALHWQQRFSWHYCTIRRGRSAKNLARSSIKKLLLHEVMTSQPIGGGVLAALTVP